MKKQKLKQVTIICLIMVSLGSYMYLGSLQTATTSGNRLVEELAHQDDMMDVRLLKEVVKKAVEFMSIVGF